MYKFIVNFLTANIFAIVIGIYIARNGNPNAGLATILSLIALNLHINSTYNG